MRGHNRPSRLLAFIDAFADAFFRTLASALARVIAVLVCACATYWLLMQVGMKQEWALISAMFLALASLIV